VSGARAGVWERMRSMLRAPAATPSAATWPAPSAPSPPPAPAPPGRERALALGLTASEYDAIVTLLAREPGEVELAMFSLLWSEHCSY
jgi:phosphoribosylformylglycinamidine synthase subunit PurL